MHYGKAVTMSTVPENRLPTRRSLISKLRNQEDHESWRQFFDTYWKLIYSFAVRRGCTDSEAEEVVQETVICLAKKMPDYSYDPAVCSFKGWLMHVTNWRVIDQVRKRRPAAQSAMPADATTAHVLEELASPGASDLESLWEQEWQKNLVATAMDRVKRKVNPEHFQIFHLLLVKQHPPQKVASLLKINIGRVYLAKHRVGALVRKEIQTLSKQLL